jgi:16S rRNA (uracil1498-N3)-methyltransferase
MAELGNAGGNLRLYVEAPLGAGVVVAPSEAQSHYLLHVMRGRENDRVLLFNGRDGEWRARLTNVTRHKCMLLCEAGTAPQADVPDLWLVFAPIKKTPADYVAQKATELGARALQPVITHRTVARRVNVGRLRANAVEAAEQSGRLSIPEVREAEELARLLGAWPAERRILFCDEAGGATPIAQALAHERSAAPWAVLTGPEGGFEPDERRLIRGCPNVLPVTLGPRIMRADTAALAALAVWNALCGDWQVR